MYENEQDRLLNNIDEALRCDYLNGWEWEFLSSIRSRIETYGERTILSAKQTHRLDEIFQKSRIY